MDDATKPEDATEETPTEEKEAQGAPPPLIPHLEFRDGMDGCEIHEVRLRFVKGPQTKIAGVKFNPQQGIVGLNLQSDLRSSEILNLVMTFGKEGDKPEDFPGLTVEADVDLLLCFRDDKWRTEMVAKYREAWAQKRAEDAETAALSALEAAPADGTPDPELVH
ncbi:MAG TPA: hypothetical protein VFI42_12910 [Thermomicrobiaceae bacterium]|nr:hypothetical protein [Thermomicrobiaceae bacterium]